MAEKSTTNEIRPFKGLTESLAERFEIDSAELIKVVKTACFPDGACTDAQLMMLLSFAKTYDLNPLASECYAFIDKKGKMHVGVQVDGWSKIANRQENFDGQEIEYETNDKGEVVAITSKTYVHGRQHPTVYRAMMKEWKRTTDVWSLMPVHQLFVKARNEGIRFAFGVPAYDPDDIERIASPARAIETTATHVEQPSGGSSQPDQVAGAASAEPSPPAEPTGTGDNPEKPKRGRPRKVELVRDPLPTAGEAAPAAAATNGTAATAGDLQGFVAAHNVPQARVNMALTKAGVERMDQLTPEQSATILEQFTKSYS